MRLADGPTPVSTLRETWRQRLGRRTRPCVIAIVGGWAVFTACVFVPAIPLAVMFAAFVTVIGGTLTLLFTVRCPRCRARLPQIGFAEWWLAESAVKPAHCPSCGFDLTVSAE